MTQLLLCEHVQTTSLVQEFSIRIEQCVLLNVYDETVCVSKGNEAK